MVGDLREEESMFVENSKSILQKIDEKNRTERIL